MKGSAEEGWSGDEKGGSRWLMVVSGVNGGE